MCKSRNEANDGTFGVSWDKRPINLWTGGVQMKNRKVADTMEATASNMTDQARDAFATVNNSLIKAIEQNRAITQNLLKAMQEESMRFMNKRLEHTTGTIEKSRECQGLSSFLTLQQGWLMDVARDYAELNKRCGEVFHEMTEQSVNQASELAADASRLQQKAENAAERAAAE